MTDKQYLSFHDFVRQYRPVSEGRKVAIEALQRITVTSEDKAIIREKLAANGFPAETRKHALFLFTYWAEMYRDRGVSRLVITERPLPLARPAPPPRAVAVKPANAIAMKAPLELDVGGSFMMVPAHAVAWVKQVSETACLVALTTGETIEADNTLGELRDQLTHTPPVNPIESKTNE